MGLLCPELTSGWQELGLWGVLALILSAKGRVLAALLGVEEDDRFSRSCG